VQCRKIGIAGRSRAKLEGVLKEFGASAPNVSILDCVDVTNPGSLLAMAQSTAVILNCVGPYRWYGEPVVQACVVAGTDYLDVCGEPGACLAYICTVSNRTYISFAAHVDTTCWSTMADPVVNMNIVVCIRRAP
jgi:short subunit dehydrogenase-like uncharacterized protein